jgi:hypothetical protein
VVELLEMAATAFTFGAVPSRGFYDDGIGRFLLSPGFPGAVALVLGLGVFVKALIQSRATRRALQAQHPRAAPRSGTAREALDLQHADAEARVAEGREDLRAQQWWRTLMWTYDQATTERSEARLPAEATVHLLEGLYDASRTDLERRIVDQMITRFRTQQDVL